MRKYRIFIVGVLCLTTLLVMLSGCSTTTADDLYSLPKASEEYLKLQEQIDAVLATGAEYSPPTSGPNRQSVQFRDLDGDGSTEAIAFFRKSGDKPLKIHVLKQSGDTYETINIIDGDGTAIESVRYADLDGDGVSELVVGWQMTATILHMTIYSIKDNQHIELADADYSKLFMTDINDNGFSDVIVLRLPSSDQPGEAVVFSLMADGELVKSSAGVSTGLESITRIMKSNLSDGTPAVFVEGGHNGTSIVTDVFIWKNDGIANIAANKASGISEGTLRAYSVYSTDINKDGIMEIPSPRLLGAETEAKYYVIDWYAYNRSGGKTKVFTTYHNFSDGWYLILPDNWEKHITVERNDTVPSERTLIFYYVSDGKTPVAFLEIYSLSGDNKEDRAKLPDRFTLLANGEMIYAAKILTTAKNISLTKALIIDNFKLIVSDWATGVM